MPISRASPAIAIRAASSTGTEQLRPRSSSAPLRNRAQGARHGGHGQPFGDAAGAEVGLVEHHRREIEHATRPEHGDQADQGDFTQGCWKLGEPGPRPGPSLCLLHTAFAISRVCWPVC